MAGTKFRPRSVSVPASTALACASRAARRRALVVDADLPGLTALVIGLRRDPRTGGDLVGEVAVEDEVLAERLAGRETGRRQHLAKRW